MRKLYFMQKLRHRLPPPNLLIAFEAAGRELSFTKAASELNVSRVAVSQQMQALEKFLGIQLFLRTPRAVKLTRAGERYHLAVSDALARMLRATIDVTRRAEDNVVNVGTTPGFMTYWLSPNLGAFRAAHPDIELRLIVSETNLDFLDNIDIAIRYGAQLGNDADTTFLSQQVLSPTCAPSLIPEGQMLDPSEILKYPLIHLEGAFDEHTRWPTWLRTQNLDAGSDQTCAGITVNSYTNLVQAVLDGQGFGLIGPPLIGRFIANGMLIQPVRAQPIARHAFYLALPLAATPSVATQAFANWIKSCFPQAKPGAAA